MTPVETQIRFLERKLFIAKVYEVIKKEDPDVTDRQITNGLLSFIRSSTIAIYKKDAVNYMARTVKKSPRTIVDEIAKLGGPADYGF